jgi:ferredoxin
VESGAKLNDDTTHEIVQNPEGHLIKRFEIVSPVIKANGLINLCKLKTHSFTYLSGAVKNHFGCIPGRIKPGYHEKLRGTGLFVDMLLDLLQAVPSRLSIMDAVVAMEGDGPSAGDPRQVGLLLASANPLAIDVVVGEITGLPPDNHPLLIAAKNRGIEPHEMGQIEVIGVPLPELRVPKFKLPPTIYQGTGFSGHLSWWQKPLQPIFKDSLTLTPRVSREKCVACAACHQTCPMEAITMVKKGEKGYAEIDDSKCIRCYCCHEMCAEDAIILKRSLLYRFAQR